MTYLQLINNVLTRLRENPTTQEVVDAGTDVYINFIGTAVNDAKNRIETAWQWGALRGTDQFPLFGGQVTPNYEIPDSADNHYIIKRIAAYENNSDTNPLAFGARNFLRWTNIDRARSYYRDPLSVQKGRPSEFAVIGTGDTGNILLTLLQPPTGTLSVPDYWLEVDHTHDQAPLTAAADILKVPSLPVYTLATALASRERGEVGGTPIPELLVMADGYLADAIADDSALYANELDWWANDNLHNTNVRFA